MASNPVQVILNDDNFLRAPDPGQGGGEKDFFENRDKEFENHRNELLDSLASIQKRVSAWSYGPAAILRVQVRTEALAKSYRPISAIFLYPDCECVGADAIGTLFFLVPLEKFPALIRRIEKAEIRVRITNHRETGKPYPVPSRARSETGAIESISIIAAEAKRNFDLDVALETLDDPASVSGYQVELFAPTMSSDIDPDFYGTKQLSDSLQRLLQRSDPGTKIQLTPRIGRTPVLEFQLTKSDLPPRIQNRSGIVSSPEQLDLIPAEIDFNPIRHQQFINALADHPLVRTIHPPMKLTLSSSASEGAAASTVNVPIPKPIPGNVYPLVGVIDSGIAAPLDDWVIDRFDFLDDTDCDAKHGTSVAGLLSVGQQLNGQQIAPEPDGCNLYDIPLYPDVSKTPFKVAYQGGFNSFLEEVDQAVQQAKEDGVRIFNLSINVTSSVDRHRYSNYAARLDKIADDHDVLFVNSCGNLKLQEARRPWQSKPKDVIAYFAARTEPDTILKPSESVRAISVGALNPPSTKHLEGAPTTYTRRGPGLQAGLKPDLCTYGGAGTLGGEASGLVSIDRDCVSTDVRGTSFAAPLVTRTLAELDHITQSTLSTDALKALVIHSTKTPAPLAKRGHRDLARQFAGFGQAAAASSLLLTDDHQITLLFESRLRADIGRPTILRFPFLWPQSLVDPNTGACSGHVRMTLVSRPPLDPAFGAEFVRVNLEASLSQRQPKDRKDGRPSFNNKIDPKHMPKSAGIAIPERALIQHGLKWWPTKQYEKTLKMSGERSEWRLEVKSLTRAEATFPPDGVPFAVVLTISDPDKTAPIFQEVQQFMQANAVQTVELQNLARVRTRT